MGREGLKTQDAPFVCAHKKAASPPPPSFFPKLPGRTGARWPTHSPAMACGQRVGTSGRGTPGVAVHREQDFKKKGGKERKRAVWLSCSEGGELVRSTFLPHLAKVVQLHVSKGLVVLQRAAQRKARLGGLRIQR
jgi:hypothetical protein